MAIDTLKVAKRLREAGFTESQAEAFTAAVQEGTEGADLATGVPERAQHQQHQLAAVHSITSSAAAHSP